LCEAPWIVNQQRGQIGLVPIATTAVAATAAAAAATTVAAATTAATATVATATTAAATTVATATTAATAAAARTVFTGLGFIDGQSAAFVHLAVERVDGGRGLIVAAHLNESETLAAAGFTVGNDFGAFDGAVSLEKFLKATAVDRIG
jgi:hypothetical protein